MINRLNLKCIDTVSSCLLDNLMLSSKTLLVMVTEKYLNCWSSCYHISISETYEEDQHLWNEWDKLKEV